ncbi:TlpA family protein disulfide reductase [Halobacillus kuroshimensis]|uniref:TlpA family protein disulfide reductase n=1 Tax=Halobacillus kuroshimensis TaxID=302481 RepID=A0ABS3DT96_9BACI|nr:TlpA disulfide reductase family protein [Halobacillus kuroshimensis]MBN8234551.1 TlpA family protein disulfide reductase [Halobacillus kuroshimensis]
MQKWIAGLFLAGLLIFGIFSVTQEKSAEQQTSDEPGISGSQDGTGMTAPNAPEGLQVGDTAPDFTLETLEGEKVSLSDFKGKKVFLNYWATWCPPCREEMPEMQRFQEAHGEEVVILAVNGTGSEKSVENVAAFVEEGGYTFPVLLDKELSLNQDYQIISIPTTYFIGTDGTIQEPRIVGPMTYEDMEKMKNALK